MANDASNHPTNSSDADMTMSGDHAEFDAVQLAQANTQPQPERPAAIPAVPNGTVHVEIPQGESVVRVAVANGETVVLPAPFDDQGNLAAKQGDGNLAIKVGDITVILEGYQQTQDVTVKDAQGDTIDLAVVLASTDPNLEIETAAGPAAGAQGADNTGALLSAFAGGAGLGGLNAVGVLDQTSLQYKLIDNSILQERGDLEQSHPLDISVIGPKDILSQSHLRDPIVTINQFTNFSYDEFIGPNAVQGGFDNKWADHDGTAPGTAADMHTTGEVVVDPHNASTVYVALDKSGLDAQGLTSNGVALHYEVSQDGSTIFGFRGNGSGSPAGNDGALVLVIHVEDTGTKDSAGATHFVVDYYLVNRLDDLDGDTNGGEDATHLNVGFDVTTSFEQTGSASSTVTFQDDAPIAADDTDSVANGLTTDGNVITGLGTTNDDPTKDSDLGGADGATVTSLVGKNGTDTDASDKLIVKGEYGTLVMNADGSYIYTRDNGNPTVDKDGNTITLQDKFTYTLTDGDGDKASANLTIDIKDSPTKIEDLTPKANGGDVRVEEDGLLASRGAGESAGSDGSGPVASTGTFKISAPDGVETVTLDGTLKVIDGGVFVGGKLTTGLGNELTVTGYDAATGTITYTYTLLDNEIHSGPGRDTLFDSDISVVVTDKDGDQATGTLSVAIVDDVPTANDDTDSIAAGGTTATGNVITGVGTTSLDAGKDVKGADGAAVSAVTGAKGSDTDASNGLEVQGQYGKLVLAADGTYTYTRDAGTPGNVSDTFTYTLKDGDGDTDTATLTINIGNDLPTVKVPTAGAGTEVNEKGLPLGSGESADNIPNNDQSEITKGVITYTEGDAPATITIQGKDGPVAVTVGAVIQGADGTMVIDSVGGGSIGYTYTLTKNTSGDNTHDDFKVSVTDKDGDNASATLVVKIIDDVPTARNDTDSVGNLKSTDGNVITGQGTTSGVTGIDVKGADGASVSAIAGSKSSDTDLSNGSLVQGTYGKLSMNADGSYTYTRDSDAPILDKNGNAIEVHDVFTYTLKDGDGDTSIATLDISIKDSGCEIRDLTPKANGGDTMVDEDGLLASRGVGESAGSDGSGPTKGDGDFTINAPDGVQNLTVDGHAVITNGVFAAATWTTGFGNTMSVTGYDANSGKITYNYTLNDNEMHAKGGGENSLYEDLNVSLTDKDGDTASGTLSVNIVDDVPVAGTGDKVLGSNPEKNNVLLVLDVTGSMGVRYPTNSSPTNKLQFEVQAAKNLLDAYLAAGNGDGSNLRVQIVTFSVKAQAWTTEWVDIQEAKEILNQIGAMTPNGNTNYDAGIQQALAVEWTPTSGAIANGKNSTYFFSDGLPNENNDGTNGLNGAQATAWYKELDDNDIKAYAIGMIDANQVNPTAAANQLGKIAYDGTVVDDPNTKAVETDDPNKTNDAIIVTDPNQLTAQIVATVLNKGAGNIVGDLGGKYGADGGSGVNSITLNGKTYTFDGVGSITTTGASGDTYTFDANHHLVITTSIGKFDIDMDDGNYTYQQKGGVETAVDVGWTLIDKDGDVSNTGTLHLLAPIPVVKLAADPHLPTATDYDAAHTIIGGNNSNTLTGGKDGDYLDGTIGNHTMKGGAGDDLYVVNGNDTVQEQFRQGHDTVMSSVSYTLPNAVEDLVLTGSGNLSGTGNDSDNTIVGNSGNNTLSGGSGNDILIGGAGADTMKGDSGNDQFLHVDKADLTSGGIDGGDGDDLVDLSGLTTFKSADGDHSRISNVEILSFTGGNATGTQVALDHNSVLSMTDANNNLVIHGDQGKDTVALSGGFTKIGTDVTANDGLHYDVFQAGSGASLVTVFVDHNLNATAS